jgi:hypothetical protein
MTRIGIISFQNNNKSYNQKNMIAGIIQRIRKEFFLNETALHIQFNWLTIITSSYFWMYGVFGFFTIPKFGVLINSIFTFILLTCFLYLVYLRKKGDINRVAAYNDSFSLSYKDVSIGLLYIAIMLAVSSRELLVPISGDNFYHSQQSQVYGIHILQFLSIHTHALDTISFAGLLWVINIVFFFSVGFTYYFLRKRNFWLQASVLSFFFIALRILIYASGGNASPFPTLRLLPLWITSTVFGFSDFSLRLASFVPLVGLMIIVYMYSKVRFGTKVAFILGLVVGTIPVVWHTGLLVEFSIWTTLLFTYVLFFLYQKETITQTYVRPLVVIGISTLMRVSGFVALIPLFIHYLLSKKRSFQDIGTYILYAIPVAIMILPIIFGNAITGTSATYQGEVYDSLGITSHASLLSRLNVLVTHGYLYGIEYNSFHLPLLIILTLLPFLIFTRKLVLWPALALFVICFILFFSVRPLLWGNGRYQAEYLAPLIIVAIFYIVLTFQRLISISGLVKKILILIFLLCLLINNFYEFKHIPLYTKDVIGKSDYFENAKILGKYFILSEFPYDYKRALITAKEEGYATSTYYIPGNGYSYFAKILSGYTLEEMRYETGLRQSIGYEFSPNTFSETIDRIKNNKDVTIILVNRAVLDKDFYPEKISDNLSYFGFKEWKNFREPMYGNTITGYIRK